MKINIKKSVATGALALSLLGVGGITGFAAAGYINWEGTDSYRETIENLENLGPKLVSIVQERDDAKNELGNKQQEIENKQKEIAEKQKEVDEKNKQIEQKNRDLEAKQRELEELRNTSGQNSSQLEQAVTDMEHVEEVSEQLLDIVD